MNGNDVERMRSTSEDLERAMQRIGQEIYSQPGAGASSDGYQQEPPQNNEPGTVEGEFREV